MKHFHLFFAMLFSVSGFSQTAIDRRDCQQIWVATYSNAQEFTGKLQAVDQNSISLMLTSRRNNLAEYNIVTIQVNDLKSVTGRDNRLIGKGAWVGALAGAGIGIISGAITAVHERQKDGRFFNNGPPVFVTILRNGAIGAGGGAFIGAAIGAIQWHIPIDGKAKNFENSRNKLKSSLCVE